MASDFVLGFIAEAKHLIDRIEEEVEEIGGDLEGHLRVAVVHLRHIVGDQDPTHRDPRAEFMPEVEPEEQSDDGEGDEDQAGDAGDVDTGEPGAGGDVDPTAEPGESADGDVEIPDDVTTAPPDSASAEPVVAEPAPPASGRRGRGAAPTKTAAAPTQRRGRRTS